MKKTVLITLLLLLTMSAYAGGPWTRLIGQNLTAYNAPSPYAVWTNFSTTANCDPFKAFDNSTFGGGACSAVGQGDTQMNTRPGSFYAIDLGSGNASISSSFNLTFLNYNSSRQFDPTAIKVEGSNDNSSWTVLGTAAYGGINTTNTAGGRIQMNYSNTVAYRYYRYTMWSNAGGNSTNTLFSELMPLRDATVVSNPYLKISVNDTRQVISLAKYNFSYTTTNGSDPGPYTGIVTNTTWPLTNYTGTITVTFTNISANTYFNTTLTSYSFTGLSTENATGLTFQNYLNLSLNDSRQTISLLSFCTSFTNTSNTWTGCTNNGTLIFYNVIGTLTTQWLNVSNGTYFNATQTLTSFNTTQNLTGSTWQNYLNITLNNSVNNSRILYFTVNISNSTNSISTNSSSASGVLLYNIIGDTTILWFNIQAISSRNAPIRSAYNVSGGIPNSGASATQWCIENYQGNYSNYSTYGQPGVSSANVADWNGTAWVLSAGQVNAVWITNIVCSGSNSTGPVYFNQSQTITNFNTTLNLTNNTFQALINLNAYRLFLNTTISSFNVTNNMALNTSGSAPYLVSANNGTNNLKIDVGGNYSLNVTCTITSPLSTGFCNATGVYDDLFKFNGTYINGTAITTFNMSLENSSINAYASSTTTNGSIFLSVLQGYFYKFRFVPSPNTLAITNLTLPANSSLNNYTFSLAHANSFYLFFYDGGNLSLITQNISIQVTNGTAGNIVTYSTVNGSFFVDNVDLGTVTIFASSSNYGQRSTSFVNNGEALDNITLYLTVSNPVIFNVIDSVSSAPIIGATIQQYTTINNVVTLVDTRTTDITGNAELNYVAGNSYTFTVTATGYVNRSFTLYPVISSTYTIKMVSTTSMNFSEDYQNVIITYNPQSLYANSSNTLTILFSSVTNNFQTYSYNITYPGGSKAGSGSTPAGQTFITQFNISGGNEFSTANLTLIYNTGLGNKTFYFPLTIIYGPGNTTFIANQGRTFGMGLIERALVGTVILVVVVGMVSLTVGSVPALLVGMMLMGLFIKIGLWEWWLAGISFLIGIAIIARRSD